ncbi:PREDICTED: uncharacterized protein LOC109114912 [Nelumbo nucifera]|uniref:Uncharacterized protein LOC109114912 n=1 Tax=Nelumbo nucifera TaxID=4432 RepID=A0A1U8Q7B4_NELNU|nr:PREDICTED: uncharacterized protein LOC109114912 [Nelumbo nucifera]
MITRGSIVAGYTTSAGRKSVRELEKEDNNPLKRARREEVIYFTEDDIRGIQYPHDDVLVVRLLSNDFRVKRILVDYSSSTNILFLEAFKRMELDETDLQPIDIPLVCFNGEVVCPLGKVRVPVEAGSPLHTVHFEHDFLVVATLSPYNAILGRPILHALQAVVSTYHLALKFPTNTGRGVMCGDQLEPRKCYVAALKAKGKIATTRKC